MTKETTEISTQLHEHYLHIDGFGRVYFDKCETDQEHMFADPPPGDDRRRCRVYIEKLLPDVPRGKKGHWKIDISFTEG